MPEPIAPGAVVDGYRVAERIHVGAQSEIFRVSEPIGEFPIIMKVPRIGPDEPDENLISFETEALKPAKIWAYCWCADAEVGEDHPHQHLPLDRHR